MRGNQFTANLIRTVGLKGTFNRRFLGANFTGKAIGDYEHACGRAVGAQEV